MYIQEHGLVINQSHKIEHSSILFDDFPLWRTKKQKV